MQKFNPGIENNTRSLSLIHHAWAFYHAYESCKEQPPTNAPKHFLGCHALELALKSVIMRHGGSYQKLAHEFGHDLEKMFEKCIAIGLEFDEDTKFFIQQVNSVHKNYFNRYLDEWPEPRLSISQEHNFVREIIQKCDPSYLDQHGL